MRRKGRQPLIQLPGDRATATNHQLKEDNMEKNNTAEGLKYMAPTHPCCTRIYVIGIGHKYESHFKKKRILQKIRYFKENHDCFSLKYMFAKTFLEGSKINIVYYRPALTYLISSSLSSS